MNLVADRFLTGLRTAWTLVPDPGYDAELGGALAAVGWRVEQRLQRVEQVLALLERGAAPPALLVTALHFPQGDTLAMLRRLAGLATPPALFVVSRQQRAVIHAAARFATLIGLRVLGHAEQPARPEQVAAAIAAAPVDECRADTPASLAPLGDEETLDLVATGRIRAWLQPKLRVDSGEVVGFEALMRGIDPDGRIVPPARLIEPLVAGGLLATATLQLAQQTIDFLNRCLLEGIPVSASVNVPLGLMSDPGFCRELVRRVEAADLDPSWLTIEITESDAMSEPAQVMENTARIRMHGFNLAIDDFGTAYASFSHLLQLPVSELKIERAFVTGLAGRPSAQAMVGACAYLGTRLGLRVVAEGVETRSDLDALAAIGCTYAQGHFVSRPMSTDTAFAWLAALPEQRYGPALPVAAD